jgi:hypothetical protein
VKRLEMGARASGCAARGDQKRAVTRAGLIAHRCRRARFRRSSTAHDPRRGTTPPAFIDAASGHAMVHARRRRRRQAKRTSTHVGIAVNLSRIASLAAPRHAFLRRNTRSHP